MPKRLVPAAPLLAALLLLSGCLFETTIDAKGGGTMHIRYRVQPNAKLEALKVQMQSPDVSIEKADLDQQGWATFDPQVRRRHQALHHRVLQADDHHAGGGPGQGDQDAVGGRAQRQAGQLADSLVEYYGRDVDIEVTLPGEVVKTNATSHKGEKATWTIPLNRLHGRQGSAVVGDVQGRGHRQGRGRRQGHPRQVGPPPRPALRGARRRRSSAAPDTGRRARPAGSVGRRRRSPAAARRARVRRSPRRDRRRAAAACAAACR